MDSHTVMLLAPVFAALAAALRRSQGKSHWAHSAWYPIAAAGVAAALSTIAELANTGSFSQAAMLAALVNGACAAAGAYRPEPKKAVKK